MSDLRSKAASLISGRKGAYPQRDDSAGTRYSDGLIEFRHGGGGALRNRPTVGHIVAIAKQLIDDLADGVLTIPLIVAIALLAIAGIRLLRVLLLVAVGIRVLRAERSR